MVLKTTASTNSCTHDQVESIVARGCLALRHATRSDGGRRTAVGGRRTADGGRRPGFSKPPVLFPCLVLVALSCHGASVLSWCISLVLSLVLSWWHYQVESIVARGCLALRHATRSDGGRRTAVGGRRTADGGRRPGFSKPPVLFPCLVLVALSCHGASVLSWCISLVLSLVLSWWHSLVMVPESCHGATVQRHA